MLEMELEVFRAGNYGEKGAYTETDLDTIARDYAATLHEAPVTIDHARSGPAFGWVKGLRRNGDRLIAMLKDLRGDFVTWLKSGAFKKRSIELYRKFSATGRPYLRAVTFLGASPPEVKGLTDPVFTDTGEFVTLEFMEDDRSPDVPVNMAEILRERDDLRLEVQRLRCEMRRTEYTAFCERLKREGRLLPAWEKKGLMEFLLSLEPEKAVSFGEATGEITPLAWFCQFMENLPPLVRLDEVAGCLPAHEALEETLPRPCDSVPVSPVSVETHRRVFAFREQNPGISYTEALARISRTPDK